MRTFKLMMLFMAVTTMTLLTSCNDDDKTTDDVTGTYNGKITVLTENSNAVAVLEETKDSYSLLLKDLNVAAMNMSIPIGNVTIENITIANGKLSGGEEKEINVTLPEALGGTEVTVKASLTSGTVSGKNLKFTLAVEVPGMPEISVNFNGNK